MSDELLDDNGDPVPIRGDEDDNPYLLKLRVRSLEEQVARLLAERDEYRQALTDLRVSIIRGSRG